MGLVLFPGFASFPANQEEKDFIKSLDRSVLYATSTIVILRQLNRKADVL